MRDTSFKKWVKCLFSASQISLKPLQLAALDEANYQLAPLLRLAKHNPAQIRQTLALAVFFLEIIAEMSTVEQRKKLADAFTTNVRYLIEAYCPDWHHWSGVELNEAATKIDAAVIAGDYDRVHSILREAYRVSTIQSILRNLDVVLTFLISFPL